MTDMKWTDYLSQDVFCRLCNCKNTKSDIQCLVNAKWRYYKEAGKDKNGFTKEDALVSVLEHLDCNSQFFDIARDEYDELVE